MYRPALTSWFATLGFAWKALACNLRYQQRHSRTDIEAGPILSNKMRWRPLKEPGRKYIAERNLSLWKTWRSSKINFRNSARLCHEVELFVQHVQCQCACFVASNVCLESWVSPASFRFLSTQNGEPKELGQGSGDTTWHDNERKIWKRNGNERRIPWILNCWTT